MGGGGGSVRVLGESLEREGGKTRIFTLLDKSQGSSKLSGIPPKY